MALAIRMNSVLILVGSETGNSLDYGERLCREVKRIGIGVRLYIMDEYPIEELITERVIFFICSTTGDGQEPNNMRHFASFILKRKLPVSIFSDISFGIFGLGDSSYSKFNFVGKRLWRRFLNLGAIPLVPFRGEGDERSEPGGLEDGWKTWFSAVQSSFINNSQLISDLKIFKNDIVYSRFDPLPETVKFITKEGQLNHSPELKSFGYPIYESKIISNSRITPEIHFQDTRLLRLQLPKVQAIDPGDILMVYPRNDPQHVEEVLNLMDISGDQIIYGLELVDSSFTLAKNIHFPTSLYKLVLEHLDLTRIPTRSQLAVLATLCDPSAAPHSSLHQLKLFELSQFPSDPNEADDYLDYVWRPKRTILQVIQDFQPTIKLALNRLFDIFKVMNGRQFSIANYAKNEMIELCVALTEIKGPNGKMRYGLTSRCIESEWYGNDMVKVSLLKGSLRVPTDLYNFETIFLIATGTGIAPIRAIIQYLFSNESFRGKVFLYFGCRSLSLDFYFKSEWDHFVSTSDGRFEYFAYGSRDVPLGSSKVYINDIILRNKAPIEDVKDPSKCLIYVAGHSRLPKIINTVFSENIWPNRFTNGLSWFKFMVENKLYQSETWS